MELVATSALVNKRPVLGGITKEDIEFPKLQLQQKMSQLVDTGKAKPGDIMDSSSLKILANETLKVEFVPLSMSKSWIEFEGSGNDKKYIGTTLITPSNEHWGFEEVKEDGRLITRQKAMNWLVLLPFQFKDKVAIPYLLTFKSTSFRTGKKLATSVAMGAFFERPIYSMAYELYSSKRTSDKGMSFHLFEIGENRALSKEEMVICEKWLSNINEPVIEKEVEEVVPF